jgi:protein-tyrosine phosphatase
MLNAKKPTQILSYLFLGGKSDAKSKESLLELNIKYILNCTPQRVDDPEFGCPNFFQKDKTFIYKRIPIFDNKGEDILPHLDSAFKFIEEGRHYGNVLVHCHKGVSRSASFVIGYLMRKSEFTFDEALSFVQSVRPVVQPNEAFIIQLQSYNPHINNIDVAIVSCKPDVSSNMNFPRECEVSGDFCCADSDELVKSVNTPLTTCLTPIASKTNNEIICEISSGGVDNCVESEPLMKKAKLSNDH